MIHNYTEFYQKCVKNVEESNELMDQRRSKLDEEREQLKEQMARYETERDSESQIQAVLTQKNKQIELLQFTCLSTVLGFLLVWMTSCQ